MGNSGGKKESGHVSTDMTYKLNGPNTFNLNYKVMNKMDHQLWDSIVHGIRVIESYAQTRDPHISAIRQQATCYTIQVWICLIGVIVGFQAGIIITAITQSVGGYLLLALFGVCLVWGIIVYQRRETIYREIINDRVTKIGGYFNKINSIPQLSNHFSVRIRSSQSYFNNMCSTNMSMSKVLKETKIIISVSVTNPPNGKMSMPAGYANFNSLLPDMTGGSGNANGTGGINNVNNGAVNVAPVAIANSGGLAVGNAGSAPALAINNGNQVVYGPNGQQFVLVPMQQVNANNNNNVNPNVGATPMMASPNVNMQPYNPNAGGQNMVNGVAPPGPAGPAAAPSAPGYAQEGGMQGGQNYGGEGGEGQATTQGGGPYYE